ncbi:hypothetical protein FDP41_003661 [Naegleria fowleri]|uniref:RING-type E3 ubiquitin transferase BRCA1 n=1 Tax=Naegleria fowleri TaxID=5763 RepID=A0A6A5BSE5_NAEFO|nr:uncharacterized protein FDP41_003661 [Naegleria fowleri]KAF0977008.1 hypothetical protein FDP41_003661 [Naegleria fowleri]CAG4711527.1 unnamed protein product [Naegleria fowleri]
MPRKKTSTTSDSSTRMDLADDENSMAPSSDFYPTPPLYKNNSEPSSRKSTHSDASTMMVFPLKQSDFDNFERELRCAICLEVWKEPTATHCSHLFCYDCIEQGMKIKKECPLCKTPILTKRHLMPMQSLANLVEEFHKFKRKFDQSMEQFGSNTNTKHPSTCTFETTTPSSMGNTYEELCSMYPDPTKAVSSSSTTTNKTPANTGRKSTANNIYGSGTTAATTSSNTVTTGKKRRFHRKGSSNISQPQDGNVSDSSTASIEAIIIPSDDFMEDDSVHDQIQRIDEQLTAKRMKLSQLEELLSDLNETYGVFGFSHERYPFLSSFVQNDIIPVTSTISASVSTAAGILQHLQHVNMQTTATQSQHSQATLGSQSSKRTSHRNSKAKRLCLCGTNLTTDAKEKLEKAAKYLGGEVRNEFTDEVTHLVSLLDENRLARRTIKYCVAVVSGVWIVGTEWLDAVLKAKCHVNEEDFCALGDVTIKYNSPAEARKSIANGNNRLFFNYRVHFHGTFSAKSKNPSKKELTDLVTFGGGTIHGTMFKRVKKSKYENVIIADNDVTREEADKIEQETGHRPVTCKWLLDSVSYLKIMDQQSYAV